MKNYKQIFTILLFLIIIQNANSQNIVNTLGTSGTFTVKDNTNTFLSVTQSNGTLSLIAPAAESQRGSIFKGSDRFLHTYYGSGTDGKNTFLGINAGNFSMTGGWNEQGSYNTVVGNSAFSSNTTGYHNSAFGYQSMNQNTTGSYNSAFGSLALLWNSTGDNNSAFGNSALGYNTSGSNNSAFGLNALFGNTTGYMNSALGSYSLSSNSTGYENSAFGGEALTNNTSGNRNSGFGRNSLKSNTTGILNSAFGKDALSSNTEGTRNSSFGVFSLYSNTIGGFNSAYGGLALYYNSTGEHNSAFGFSSLFSNTGSYNSAFGYNTLYNNTSGQNNAAFGYSTLFYSTGSNNTALGTYAGNNITTGSNNIVVGYGAQVPTGSSSNQIRIGNTDITYAGVQVAWTITSDRRWKDNIQTSQLGLDFISKLNPVSYTRNNDKSKKTEYGLIAQELEEVLKEFNVENTGMLTVDDNGYYHLRYNDLIAPIIKSIQELKSENESLKTENAELLKRLTMLEKMQNILVKVIKENNRENNTKVANLVEE